MSSRPIDEAVATRTRGKFVAGADDRPAAAEESPAPFWARGPPSTLELERMLTLGEVAEFTGLSEDGIRRHYAHLIRRLSPRRVGMKLRDALTINVTRFYRNAETWNVLRRDILPLLCADIGEIRVWSAGCSSGEEAYTIAILVAEELERTGRSRELCRLEVDATDVDRESLQRARAARYRQESLLEMPPDLTRRYFEAAALELQVVPRIRDRVLCGPGEVE